MSLNYDEILANLGDGGRLHHPNEIYSSEIKRNAFQQKLDHNRCSICWLRNYECYCKYGENLIVSSISDTSKLKAEVVIYYHFSELGRSPNTAHLFQVVAPQIVERTLIFGDVPAEVAFLQDLIREKQEGIERTCILYPTYDAENISDWSKRREQTALKKGKKDNLPLRIVLLDGTYSHSVKQLKFIQNHFHNIVPIVKLDLGDGCRSAIAGIMQQPTLDKICSFQAVAIAFQQVQVESQFCAYLLKELDKFLAYILKRKIRFGKRRTKLIVRDDQDNIYSDFIQNHLDNNPPPIGVKVGKKQRKYESMLSTYRGAKVGSLPLNIYIRRTLRFAVFEYSTRGKMSGGVDL